METKNWKISVAPVLPVIAGQLQCCSVSPSLGYKLMERFLSGLKGNGTHMLTANLHETSAYMSLGEAGYSPSSELGRLLQE